MAEVPLEMNASRSAIFSNSGIRSEIDFNYGQYRYTWSDKDYSLIQLYNSFLTKQLFLFNFQKWILKI